MASEVTADNHENTILLQLQFTTSYILLQNNLRILFFIVQIKN
jgi:hypothetical protein